jgi:Ca2+-binding EF-hand superfamily protein
MRTYFQRIDFDKDGNITRNDFTAMADRFAQKATSGADVLRNRITSVYDNYLGKATGGKPVNQEEFVKTMKEQINNADMKEKLKGPLPLFFQAVDTDEDGMISGPEFENFFEIIGLDKSMAPETFKAIDENNDGQLSKEEFVNAGLDFFENQEPSVNQIFWGPLVQ